MNPHEGLAWVKVQEVRTDTKAQEVLTDVDPTKLQIGRRDNFKVGPYIFLSRCF